LLESDVTALDTVIAVFSSIFVAESAAYEVTDLKQSPETTFTYVVKVIVGAELELSYPLSEIVSVASQLAAT